MKNSVKSSAMRINQDHRSVLDRILDTPHLEQVVPRLQPDLLHRVIQSCGLEDCGELVVLATPEQLARIFDLDLWRPVQPGADEQFDADRFGKWLEVLAEFGAGAAAQKLAAMDADLVIVGLAQHARVFDSAVVTTFKTTDGVESVGVRGLDHELCEIGGYRLVAKRGDSWDAIVAILIELDAEHSDFFHQVMRGCRALSNSTPEPDGLHGLLGEQDQISYDAALDREQRRDEQGYVTPAQARAFLDMSRRIRVDSDTVPTANPIACAYLRSLEETTATQNTSQHLHPPSAPVPPVDSVKATAALVNVLLDAGIIPQQPRGLLNASQEDTTLRHIRAQMESVFDRDHAAYVKRSEELTYIANTIMAGCSLQGRSFTAQEASDAAVAVCNLGLENWPLQWISAKSLPDDFLINRDLVTVFQVGWTTLYKNVVMYASEHLVEVLAGLQCDDRHVRTELLALRAELLAGCRAGIPWRARNAMEVIAMLDMPVWAALLGLIDECPVMHAALSALRSRQTRSVSASAFEFISENSQVVSIQEFVQSLAEILRP